jgi:hypothetical protein
MTAFPAKDVTLIVEFIDANELGLALEQMADVLSEDELPLSADERADMLATGFPERCPYVPKDEPSSGLPARRIGRRP